MRLPITEYFAHDYLWTLIRIGSKLVNWPTVGVIAALLTFFGAMWLQLDGKLERNFAETRQEIKEIRKEINDLENRLDKRFEDLYKLLIDRLPREE